MAKKHNIKIKAPILQWLRTRPFHEINSFKKWYLEYHEIPSDWIATDDIPSERVRREISAILDIEIEVVEAINEQPPWEE